MRSANIRYLPQVDHLRAFAAVWIVLYHGLFVIGPKLVSEDVVATVHSVPTLNPLSALWSEGHTAVALFMVLSGFIFTVGSFERDISYKDFVVNRILRIYPLYVVMLFFALSNDHPHAKDFANFWITLLPLADFTWQGHSEPFVQMAWAVSVEVQFYLLYPFLLRFLNKNPLRFTISLIGTALMFRLMELGDWASPRDVSYWHLLGRIDQFALGMFAATLFLRLQGRERLFRQIFCVALPATVLLIWGFQGFGGGLGADAKWNVLWPTAEGCAWSSVVLGYVGMRQKMSPLISMIIGKIGEMSFSIYLIHRIIVDIVGSRPWAIIGPAGAWRIDALSTTVLIVLPITLAVSAVTYRVIERPFLSLRRRYVHLDQSIPSDNSSESDRLLTTPEAIGVRLRSRASSSSDR